MMSVVRTPHYSAEQLKPVEEGYAAMATGRGGGLDAAAPQPALAPPQPPSFPMGPPESVTVSIIIDNDVNARQCGLTSLSLSLNFLGNHKEEDDDEEERLGAWIYKTSRTAKHLAEKVLLSSPSQSESHP
jgi:hypothetical protein